MILDDAWQRVRSEAEVLAAGQSFPLWTDNGSWVTAPLDQPHGGILPHHGSWMAGDLAAILWLLASHESDPARRADWQSRARAWSHRLESRASVTAFASVSHLFFRGALLPISVAGETALEPLAHSAAETIIRRFETIGYLKSFGEPSDNSYPFTTVDDVINLAVPLWHAESTGDQGLRAAAISAAQVIGDRLVRPNGSCGQVLRFDEGGRPSTIDTYQGYTPDGCWSRGLAWGIYGYATIFRQTGNPVFLQFADAMADYWIERVQDNPAPLWDFDLPAAEPQIRDSFAATLGYAGLLELAGSAPAPRRQSLTDYARTMLERLSADQVLARPHGPGIVGGAALDVPHQHGIDCSVIVADSYYVEALWRLGAGHEHLL